MSFTFYYYNFLVVHAVRCSVCRTTPVMGLRYRCIKCTRYTQCQHCFLTGRVSHSHKLSHSMKEYCSEVSQFKTDIFFSKDDRLLFFFFREVQVNLLMQLLRSCVVFYDVLCKIVLQHPRQKLGLSSKILLVVLVSCGL